MNRGTISKTTVSQACSLRRATGALTLRTLSKRRPSPTSLTVLAALLGLTVSPPVAAQTVAESTARAITLKEVVRIALEQNPDVLLARLEEAKAKQAVVEARAPFTPQIGAGSGLAYTSGIPQSVEGSNPSVVRVVGQQFLYNKPQRAAIRQAGAMVTAAEHGAAGKQDEIAFHTAATYLDFERAWRLLKLADERVESLRRIEEATGARVEEGRQIHLELSRQRLQRARAEQQAVNLRAQMDLLEATLRRDLNLPDSARLTPSPTKLAGALPLPENKQQSRERAAANSPELKRLLASLRAKGFEMEAEKGARLPRVDLVAQYSLLARFNNYDQFFNDFQRHNFQIGMAFEVPLFTGKRISSRVGRVALETQELRLRHEATESLVELEAERLYQQVEQAEGMMKVARMELDFARESLSVEMARMDEGRADLETVERARNGENEAWEAFYDSQYTVQKAKLNLLRQTGELVAALR
ncbi:MAG: TolC family protein [Bryobacterales bacterium]